MSRRSQHLLVHTPIHSCLLSLFCSSIETPLPNCRLNPSSSCWKKTIQKHGRAHTPHPHTHTNTERETKNESTTATLHFSSSLGETPIYHIWFIWLDQYGDIWWQVPQHSNSSKARRDRRRVLPASRCPRGTSRATGRPAARPRSRGRRWWAPRQPCTGDPGPGALAVFDPLVDIQKTMENHRKSPFVHGKITISKMNDWLMVGPYPSEKWWSQSVGMMTFPIYGKMKNVPNHPPNELIWAKTLNVVWPIVISCQ